VVKRLDVRQWPRCAPIGVDPAAITRFAHGSTVATNAVIERKGTRTGIITTAGFKDVLEIVRHQMYDPVAPAVLLSFNQ
jgi:N-methylhydantoinase A